MKKLLNTLCFTLVAVWTSQAHAVKPVNFNFTDVKGKNHQLSDYRGKWVLVNFWAPWCPRCKIEYPDLNDLDSRSDFVVIGVAQDYGIDQGSVHNIIQRYNLRFPQIMGGNRRDPGNPALQVGPVDFYPTSYLYAPDGDIVMFLPGIISRQKLAAFMQSYEQQNPTAFAKISAPQQPVQAAVAPAVMSEPPATSAVKSVGFAKSTPASSRSKIQNKKKVAMY